MKRAAAAIAMLVLASACGSGSDVAGVSAPLPAADRALLLEMMESVGRVEIQATREEITNGASSRRHNLRLRYEATAAGTDITKLEVDGAIESIVSARDQTFEGSADLRGTIHSRRHGAIAYTHAGRWSGTGRGGTRDAHGEITVVLAYSDTRSVRLTQRLERTYVRYLINGTEVRETEFNAFFERTRLPANPPVP